MGAIKLEDLPKMQTMLDEHLDGLKFSKIERLGGLTNHTYHVTLTTGRELVLRIPGEGTEDMIDRADEQKCAELASKLSIDSNCIYFGTDGSKITEYIPDAETMNADKLKEESYMEEMADIYKRLHHCGVDTGVKFDVFDMAKTYEKIIIEHKVPMFKDYDEVKNTVIKLKKEIDTLCDTTPVPCHNDPLCENWVHGSDRMYLIDWEYGGMNDGMWDVADISIEAGYDKKLDDKFLRLYLGKEPDTLTWKHFYANKIYVDYLWTLWAMTRVPFDGKPMADWAEERYTRLKGNIEAINNL